MRFIAALPDNTVPNDEEFRFRERAQNLLDQWHALFVLAYPPSPNGQKSPEPERLFDKPEANAETSFPEPPSMGTRTQTRIRMSLAREPPRPAQEVMQTLAGRSLLDSSLDTPYYIRAVVLHVLRMRAPHGEPLLAIIVDFWLTFERKEGFRRRGDVLEAINAEIPLMEWRRSGMCPYFEANIGNLSLYAERFNIYWWNIAPEWRYGNGRNWKMLEQPQQPALEKTWSCLRCAGVDGWCNIVVSIGWWINAVCMMPRSSLEEECEYQKHLHTWRTLADDVIFCLKDMISYTDPLP